MRKYIITFRNKVFDGQRWLTFLVVDQYSLYEGKTYSCLVGDRQVNIPIANVLGVVETTGVKNEKERG